MKILFVVALALCPLLCIPLLAAGIALPKLLSGLLSAAAVGLVTANQLYSRKNGERGSAPVYQAVHLYEGTLAFFNTSGFLVGTVASGANPFAGIMLKEADNSGGSDGDLTGEFLTDGDFPMYGSGFSQATVGADIYATDNFTVQTSSSSASYVGQCVEYVSATQIIVRIKKTGPSSALAGSATGTTAATFTVDSDVGKPKMQMGSQTGGTGDFALKTLPPSTLTADRTATHPVDASGNYVMDSCFAATPAATATAGNTIPAGYSAVAVGAVTNDANDWITLPAIASVPIGFTIVIACNAGGNFELRTPASSNTKINDVDSDGTQEYLCTDTDVVIVRKATTTGWVAQSLTKLGAVRTAVVPD